MKRGAYRRAAGVLLLLLVLVLGGCVPPVETFTGTVTERFDSEWGVVLCIQTAEGPQEITLSDITGYVPSAYASADAVSDGCRVQAVCQGSDRNGRPFVSKLYLFSQETTAQPGKTTTQTMDSPDGIWLETVAETCTPASAALRLHNESLAELVCLEGAAVQQEMGGAWYDLIRLSEEETLKTAGHELEAGHIMQFTAVWANVCGVLPQGHYRVVQPVEARWGERTESYLLAAEFMVDE